MIPVPPITSVIPAKAGIQTRFRIETAPAAASIVKRILPTDLDSCLRRNDVELVGRSATDG